MNKLEQNNLDAQISLMKDILGNHRSITYCITEKGKELLSIIRQRKYTEDEKSMVFTKEQFDKMWEIAANLSEEEKFERLGILAKTAVPDNVVKRNILQILQK